MIPPSGLVKQGQSLSPLPAGRGARTATFLFSCGRVTVSGNAFLRRPTFWTCKQCRLFVASPHAPAKGFQGVRMTSDGPPPTFPTDAMAPRAGNGAEADAADLSLADDLTPLPDSYAVLEGVEEVAVRLPLDVYLEETGAGVVFVDEVVAGGNAISVLREGDVVVAVSLPFGDGLVPVAKEEGLRMVEQFVRARGEMEEFFRIAVRRGEGVEELRAQVGAGDEGRPGRMEMGETVAKIFVKEYPIVEAPKDEGEKGFDAEFLREAGFDV